MNDSSADMVLMDIADGVMRLTLNRADRANAIAPEGRESEIGGLEEGTNGAAFLALKSGAPATALRVSATS